MQGAESGCHTEKERQIVLNCCRLLTRILPYIFEDPDWRGFFWSTVPGAGRGGVCLLALILLSGGGRGGCSEETLCTFGGNFIPVISIWSETKWHLLGSFPSFDSCCSSSHPQRLCLAQVAASSEYFTWVCSCRRALVFEGRLLQYN